MSISEEKLKKFIGIIKSNASAEAASIENDVKQLTKTELSTAEDEAIKEAYMLAKEEQTINSVKISKEFSEKELKLKQEIYEKRLKIVDEIFSRVVTRLSEYCLSPDYKALLINGFKAVCEKFGDNKCIVKIKERDMYLSDDISEIFNGNCVIKISDDIKIGGALIEIPDLDIIVDETLDTVLFDEKNLFFENKDFRID